MKSNKYRTLRVQFKLADDGKYYLIDLNPKNIEFGDIVTEETYMHRCRLTEIDSVESIDYNIHRKVIASQDQIGMRTVYDVVHKLELESIKNLHKDEAIMWVETEKYNTPKVENDLYICSYLYYPTTNVLDQEEWEKAMLEPHSYYDIDAKAKYDMQKKLEEWQNHKPSSWLGKWYRQIQIDKLKRKLEND
jgi:hypothetical protein